MPCWVMPLSVANEPPTMRRPVASWATIDTTSRSAVGAHGSRAPVVASTAARRLPGLAVDRGEVTADVEGVADDLERLDPGVDNGPEGPDRAGDGVDRRDPVPELAVDRREVTAHVDGAAVDRGLDVEALGVERGGPCGVEHAGADVEGEEVRARGLVLARRRTGRAGLGELPGDVDGVADDDLVPHHAVDLDGGEGIRADRGGDERRDRCGVCGRCGRTGGEHECGRRQGGDEEDCEGAKSRGDRNGDGHGWASEDHVALRDADLNGT